MQTYAMKSKRLQPSKNNGGLATEWFVGLTETEKQEFEQYLRNSTRLFDHLRKMIQRRYDETLGTKVIDYDSPSWSHKAAHINGKLEAFEELSRLLP